MTKSNNEWVPDLKEECGIDIREENGISHIRWGKMEYLGSKYLIFRDQFGEEFVFETGSVIGFLPIKTEAEKRRDVLLEDMISNVPRYEYEHLHVVEKIVNHTCKALIDAGYTIKKPVVTDEDINDVLNTRDCLWRPANNSHRGAFVNGAKWMRSKLSEETL